jgi:hypothetical protein
MNPGTWVYLETYGNRSAVERTITYRSAVLLQGDRYKMLWTIFVVLLVLWLLGFVGFHVLGAYIHILLLIALVVLILQLVGGRRTVV